MKKLCHSTGELMMDVISYTKLVTLLQDQMNFVILIPNKETNVAIMELEFLLANLPNLHKLINAIPSNNTQMEIAQIQRTTIAHHGLLVLTTSDINSVQTLNALETMSLFQDIAEVD
jgi:hypothetical protein